MFPQDKGQGEVEILLLWHGTIVPSCIIKFSATLWFATITNSGCSGAGSKSFCVEDMALVEVELLVKDMIS